MLPAMLSLIKRSLEKKSSYELGEEEKALLEELRFLDRDDIVGERFRKRGIIQEITSGPVGKCPCCGR